MELQQEHGYDVLVVTAKEALMCPECSFVLRDAVQTNEGLRLCDPCYRRLAKYVHLGMPYYV